MRKLLLFIILLLVVGCTAPAFELTKENILNEPDRAIKVCKTKEDVEMFDCFADVGTTLIENKQSQKALAVCEAVPVNIRDFCYIELAKKSGSDLPCMEMRHSGDKDNCYYDIAKQKESALSCLEIEDEDTMNNCLFDVGIKAKDHEICDGITDSRKANDCYYAICSSEKDVEACKKITGQWGDNELYMMAAEDKDAEVCKQMSDQANMDNCLNDVAVALGDADICRDIKGEQKKGWCLDDVAKITAGTDTNAAMAACADMTVGKDDCYWNVFHIVLKEDHSKAIKICKRLENGVDDCLLDVSRVWRESDLDKGLEACKSMSSQAKKTYCAEEMVGTEKAVKVDLEAIVGACEMSSDKDYCYKILADTFNKLNEGSKARDTCRKMEDDWERSQCVLKYR